MPAEMNAIPRIQLPRSLIGRQSFHFLIGQTVDFYGHPAVIISRQLTAAGRETYGINIDCAERPHRIVRGEYLAPLTPNTCRATPALMAA